MGALGVMRAQDEHDLLTEQAVTEGKSFKLVSHAAWRAPGVVVFFPSQEPTGNELGEIIRRRHEAERVDTAHAMVSSSVLLVQDPWRSGSDLMKMINRNPRTQTTYPDLIPTKVIISRLRDENGDRIMFVERPGAIWPTDTAAWTIGEMNRIDIGDTRMFELPSNLGGIGPRAAMIKEMQKEQADLVLTADLGHQNSGFGLTGTERAHVDWTALQHLGYRYLVPFEFELGLGVDQLKKVAADFPAIHMLAANVKVADSTLFRGGMVLDTMGVRIGLIGLVNGTIGNRLPRKVLSAYQFESPMTAATREVQRMRKAGVAAIVVLSNMNPADNALVAQEVLGIDAIISDMPVRTAPEPVRVTVNLPNRPFSRPGTPALVARSAANGIGIGRLDLEIRSTDDNNILFLGSVAHSFTPVKDDGPSDTALVRTLIKQAALVKKERGELLFPAFLDIVAKYPELGNYDEVTRLGRVSKPMWEGFLARRLRIQSNAELAVIRQLDQFPPLIGKLHQHEVESWLWMEDEIIELDIPGADLRALLSTARGELATSGIDMSNFMVLGHNLNNDAFYRVVTTDILFEGGRSNFFRRARRVRRLFEVDAATGKLVATESGKSMTVRDFMMRELGRIRDQNKGDSQIDAIASLLLQDPPHVDLFSFSFERPTLWTSFNNVTNNKGYENVPESRVVSPNSLVAGLSGRFVLSKERKVTATDLGIAFAYALQKLNQGPQRDFQESADDIRIDLTFRPSSTDTRNTKPFVRSLFDSEFSPTINSETGLRNPRQLSLRVVAGFQFQPGPSWRSADFGLLVENDFGRPNPQLGIQSKSEYVKNLAAGRHGALKYFLRNDLTYFFPAPLDTKANLSLRYGMVNELIVPLVDELSLSIAADFFFFRGKVQETRRLGVGSQLRVGITYNRLWKPRYQPFF